MSQINCPIIKVDRSPSSARRFAFSAQRFRWHWLKVIFGLPFYAWYSVRKWLQMFSSNAGLVASAFSSTIGMRVFSSGASNRKAAPGSHARR